MSEKKQKPRLNAAFPKLMERIGMLKQEHRVQRPRGQVCQQRRAAGRHHQAQQAGAGEGEAMKAARARPFTTEAELCRRFLEGVAKAGGWTAYAETAGWDILLVRDADGFQIGIEAKLKLNLQVINQALDGDRYTSTMGGPDCRAVMVPDCEPYGFETIAAYIGITIIRVSPAPDFSYRDCFQPALPKIKEPWQRTDWHEWCPTQRHKLPEYVPDVVAGSSAPLQLTDWKIGALKIVAILESRGYVTRDDFKHVGIDHRRWLKPASWLVVEDGRYVAGHMPDFKGQHPAVYAKIVADSPKWMPKAPGKLASGRLL